MQPHVSFEAMSAVRNVLDVRLMLGNIEYDEWVVLVDSLGWTDEDLLKEVSRRWDPQRKDLT